MPTPTVASGDDQAIFLSAVDLMDLFARKVLSPVELIRLTIEQCERMDPLLNAVVDTLYDQAIDQARESERRYAQGTARPLEGIPVALKAQQPMSGRSWTDGSVVLRDRVAEEDHPVVRRVGEAGGIIHIRTATPEFCCMPFTHSTLWGTTRNPWSRELSPGGSSGGAVASLAAGMTVLATGSDSGGSLRSPASFTGTVGFKPPYGTIPTIAPANLDPFWQDGALARTVDDCSLLLGILAGHDPQDMASLPGPSASLETATRSPRIGVLTNLGNWRVDREIVADILRVGQALAADLDVHATELNWDRRDVNHLADAHFGDHGALDIARLARRSDALTDYSRAFAARTTAAAAAYRPQDRNRAAATMYRDVAVLFEQFDAIICPTVGITGLLAGETYLDHLPVVDGAPLESLSDINLTRPFNVLNRLPAISVPSGAVSSAGLPLGVQIVARPYDTRTVLDVARRVERVVGRVDHASAMSHLGISPAPVSVKEI